MDKILLVQQYLGNNNEVGPVFPIGLAYIATAIAQTDWNVRVLDMNICEDPYDTLNNTLETYQPDVIGLSLRNIDNVDYDNFNYFYQELNTLIPKLKQHSAKLIVGGAGFSIFAKDIMMQYREIDFGIIQEGEETIVELLNAVKNGTSYNEIPGVYTWNNQQLSFGGQRKPMNFSKSLIPDRSFFEIEKYNKPLCMGVQTKRGCSLKCSYCTYPFINKNTERFRTPESVVEEIEILVNKFLVEEIIFCDDIFNVPLNHAKQIIEGIIERNIKVKWSAWFDVGSTDESFIRLAVKSGCYRFCFSTEGVVDTSLKSLHKNFNAKQADKLINICLAKEFKGIDFRFSLFALPPGQTYWGLLKTLYVVFRTHVLYINSKCLVSWIRVLPNTELYSSIENKDVNLLPVTVTDTNKDDLFYKFTSLNHWVITIYKYLLNKIIALRNIRKKIHKLMN